MSKIALAVATLDSVVMLRSAFCTVILSISMVNVITINVITLNVVMPNVAAPK